MLIVCGPEITDPDPEMVAASIAWRDEMNERGVRKFGSRLRPASTATTLRGEEGRVLVSDGPFAETKEQILGFDILECADLDEAIEVASEHPWVQYGSIEVRPLWPA
jgi:hypothetical protein